MMKLRKGEIEFNIENISLELEGQELLAKEKSLTSMKTLKTFISESKGCVRLGLFEKRKYNFLRVMSF